MYNLIITTLGKWNGDNPLLYAIAVIFIMAVEGIFLGLLVDVILGILGISGKKNR